MRVWLMVSAFLLAFAIDPDVFDRISSEAEIVLAVALISGFLWDLVEFIRSMRD